MDSVRQVRDVAKSFVQGTEAPKIEKGGSNIAIAMASAMKHIPKLEPKIGENKVDIKRQCANAVWGASLAAGGIALCVACPSVVLAAATVYLLEAAINRTTAKKLINEEKPARPSKAPPLNTPLNTKPAFGDEKDIQRKASRGQARIIDTKVAKIAESNNPAMALKEAAAKGASEESLKFLYDRAFSALSYKLTDLGVSQSQISGIKEQQIELTKAYEKIKSVQTPKGEDYTYPENPFI